MIPLGFLAYLFLIPIQTKLQACLLDQTTPLCVANRHQLSLPGHHGSNNEEDTFSSLLQGMGIPESSCDTILEELVQVGLLEDRKSNAQTLLLMAQDFEQRPESFSTILISDFGLPPLIAHQVRAVVMAQLRGSSVKVGDASRSIPSDLPLKEAESSVTNKVKTKETSLSAALLGPVNGSKNNINSTKEKSDESKYINGDREGKSSEPAPRAMFKSVVVNARAKERRTKVSDDGNEYDYGLPSDYENRFPTIASELQDFYSFMTKPATSSQEPTIRPATAVVYLRHAKLFLGWYATTHNFTEVDNGKLSLYKIFPNKQKSSADPILSFVLWLRSSRKISVSYEANVLRGLTKLLKFRFSQESQSDPAYGEKSFDDIPLIREIRMLHRDANNRQKVAPRSSDEKQKWLSWPEYLNVVTALLTELSGMLEEYHQGSKSTTTIGAKKKIAVLFQKYLILAIFASVPDRQRTLRELEIGRNFQKDDTTGCWCIRHAAEDYKTGKAYGERPPLQLAEHLTPWVDGFLEHWRPHLSPVSDTLFAQSRTGKPLTQNSVYQVVSRCCWDKAGKRTNPHLLRDMLVTHVRESNASEKELEALALYMGHSIQMQRSSYDRRTLTKKVAPAVQLMQSINGDLSKEDG
ncbi:expressed unknown protein [Seminavis robusta]|uniref:Tyr recombinase domain-containing protein n=1 Tax=Seminavis robusta TaxID=568900 RepID=A0A9N8DDE6_9STRA|nr:expressed unknown protein [Seminavis robusta]|eukprot:Sro103_g052310.1 n/a (636) ;mRNA; f:10669-12576